MKTSRRSPNDVAVVVVAVVDGDDVPRKGTIERMTRLLERRRWPSVDRVD